MSYKVWWTEVKRKCGFRKSSTETIEENENEPVPSTSRIRSNENPSTSSSLMERKRRLPQTSGETHRLDDPISRNSNNQTNRNRQWESGGNKGFGLSLYGWRKKCLFVLLLLLMILIVINLALTFWIIRVLEFSPNGIGRLKIVPTGIQVDGQASFLGSLRASKIKSKPGQPITIESFRNFTINARNEMGYVENQLFINHDRFEVSGRLFKVTDLHGHTLFSADKNAVSVGAHQLRVEGEGGIVIKDSIQTPAIKAPAGKSLKLESPTRSIEIQAAQEINIQSRAGSIEAKALNDVKLHSANGYIRFDAADIRFPNLKIAQPVPSYASTSTSTSHNFKVYQLCACHNGRLFLANPHGICATDDPNICR